MPNFFHLEGNQREILGEISKNEHFVVSLSFWECLLCSRIQEMSSIYCVLITMVSEHNKALSPCIHLCFWECRGFGNCTGPTQRHPLFWRQRDEPALSTGEEAGRKSCYCELDIKK